MKLDIDIGEFAMSMLFTMDAPPRLFGAWGITSDEHIMPTPVGVPCMVCHVAIADGDVGELLERRDNGGLEPFHVECLGLVLFGHKVGVCGCTEFAGLTGPDGRPNWREAAIEVTRRMNLRIAEAMPSSWRKRREEPPS